MVRGRSLGAVARAVARGGCRGTHRSAAKRAVGLVQRGIHDIPLEGAEVFEQGLVDPLGVLEREVAVWKVVEDSDKPVLKR